MSTPAPVATQALAVAVGGAAGSLARWQAAVWMNALPWPFAVGTWFVNLLGGALIGFSLVWFQRQPNDLLRLLLVTGGLGGLTTFSAYSAESLGLLLRGEPLTALLHTLAHVAGGLAAAALGWQIGRWVLA